MPPVINLKTFISKLASESSSRLEFWISLIETADVSRVAEIGVYRGELAEVLLRECQRIDSYLLVDPWKHLQDWNKPANIDDETFEAYYQETIKRTLFAKQKLTICRTTTLQAIQSIADDSLDLAYIDGDHTLRGITLDLNSVYTKVIDGGIVGGDDFCPTIWQHKKTFEPTFVFPYAVHFAEAKGDHLYALPFNQFLIHKRPNHDYRFYDLTGKYSCTTILNQLNDIIDLNSK